tara:strand:+ start:3099 stop:3842 length:744 start_codon:yes stop_codon:yes gene_type:complete
MFNNNETSAVVQTIEDSARDVYYWHELALKSENDKSLSNLKHAEALFWVNENENFRKLGYRSIQEYVFKYFSRSKSWGVKLISIHKKFREDLDFTIKELEHVTFGKLALLVGVVSDREEAESWFERAKDMTQAQIAKAIKLEKGEENSLEEVDDDTSKISFAGPKEAIEVVQASLREARQEYANEAGRAVEDIIDFQGLEYMAAHFLSVYDMESNDPSVTLHATLRKLEAAHGIKLTYTKITQNEEV